MLLKIQSILILLISGMLLSCASSSISDDRSQDITSSRDISGRKWVTARSGLVLRDAPGLTAKRIELIPQYATVRCVKELITEETIEGVRGLWTCVEWERNHGWVFGGFLSSKKPAFISRLQNQAYEYYRRIPRTGRLYGSDTSPDDISVKEVLGSYAVVRYRQATVPAGDIAEVDSIWRFMGADWEEVAYDSDTGMQAHLLHLNNDGYVDCIKSSGCCGNDLVEICLGTRSGFFNTVYRSPDSGCMVTFESMGKGGETVIRIRDNMTDKVDRLRFDIGRNEMVPIR